MNNLSSSPTVLPFPECPVQRLIRSVAFGVWLPSQNTKHFCVFRAACWRLLFLAEWFPVAWFTVTFLSVTHWGTLGRFPVFDEDESSCYKHCHAGSVGTRISSMETQCRPMSVCVLWWPNGHPHGCCAPQGQCSTSSPTPAVVRFKALLISVLGYLIV